MDEETKTCDSNNFAIFTNVNNFTEWIREKAEEKCNYTKMGCKYYLENLG